MSEEPTLPLSAIKELLPDCRLKEVLELFKKVQQDFTLYETRELNKILALMNRKVAELTGCFK